MAAPNHEDWVLMQAIAEGDELAINTRSRRSSFGSGRPPTATTRHGPSW